MVCHPVLLDKLFHCQPQPEILSVQGQVDLFQLQIFLLTQSIIHGAKSQVKHTYVT
jgi:hypothetical protein